MSELPLDTNLYILLSLHCLIGGIAAIIAQQKGYRLGTWLILGLVGGTVALIVALWMKTKEIK